MIEGVYYAKAAAVISVAFLMGIGSVGAALGQGLIGAKACENIGKYPESAKTIRAAMMLALIFVETGAIYCLLLALILVYVALKLA